MKYELLKPDLLIPQLEERLDELKEALKKVSDSNSKQTLKDYSLRIAQKHGHTDYYYVNKDTPPAGIYIPKNNSRSERAISSLHTKIVEAAAPRWNYITHNIFIIRNINIIIPLSRPLPESWQGRPARRHGDSPGPLAREYLLANGTGSPHRGRTLG